MILDNIVAERLSSSHDVSNFDCGVTSLNNFLVNDALIHQRQRISFTTVYLYNNEIIGYLTLANDSVNLDLIEEIIEDLDTRYPQVPALKVCRIARHVKYIGQGLGEYILDDAKAFAHNLNKTDNIMGTGCRFVTVDIRDPSLIMSFYAPNDFEFHTKTNGIFYYRFDLGSLPE